MTLGEMIKKLGVTPDFIFHNKYVGQDMFDLTVSQTNETETDRGTEITFEDGTILEITDGATIVRR